MIGDPRAGIASAMMQRPQQLPQQMQQVQQQRPMNAAMMGGNLPAAAGIPAGAGTQDASNTFNTMNKAFGPTPAAAGGGLGGNLGLSGMFDPSNWNSGLPSGSLTGGY